MLSPLEASVASWFSSSGCFWEILPVKSLTCGVRGGREPPSARPVRALVISGEPLGGVDPTGSSQAWTLQSGSEGSCPQGLWRAVLTAIPSAWENDAWCSTGAQRTTSLTERMIEGLPSQGLFLVRMGITVAHAFSGHFIVQGV